MNVELLPMNSILIYPYGQPQTPNRRILEDNGVVPDVEVAQDRASLLEARDLQLEAALASLDQEASTGDQGRRDIGARAAASLSLAVGRRISKGEKSE
jgi:C-terminal processing protease CtpA/Prc